MAMMNLTVFDHEGTLVTDSREVAKMVVKEHFILMRDIRGYIEILEKSNEYKSVSVEKPNAPKIRLIDFFIESTYKDPKGEMRPCYLVTKQGCEMVANKLTGEKGVLFTAAYVSQFNDMENELKGGKVESPTEKQRIQSMRAEAMLRNSKSKEAGLWVKMGEMLNTQTHKQICASYGSEVLCGRRVIPLPPTEQTYSAGDVGKFFGITANMVGRIANQYGLKTEENGQTVLDKSRYSEKEMPTFRYNEHGKNEIGKRLSE